MVQLDWQTEVEDWEAEAPPPKPPSPPHRRASWRLLLVSLFLLTATLLVIGRRVGLQVQQVAEATHEDVLAAHRLLLQAANEQDEELFAAMMADKNGWWREAQLDMVSAGTLTNREPLGLNQQEPVTEATVTNLSPDLDYAKVSFPVVFAVHRPDSLTETVTLQQNMTFVQDQGDWRYTQPDTLSWGEWQMVERDQVRIAYREAEGEIGARLAADLIQAIHDMCLYTGSCPPDTEINIRLEESLNSLPQVARTIFPTERRISLGLPTPLLVGHPTDEAGYQALRRGYARHVLSFLILRWEAPDIQTGMETYHDALLRRRLVDLGLTGWPSRVTPAPDAPPFPFPDQSLATLCVAEPGQGSQLLVYDLRTERWKIYLRNGLLTQLVPIPDDDGLLVFRRDQSRPDEHHLVLWRPGDPVIEIGRSLGVRFDGSSPGATIQIIDRGYGWGAFRLLDVSQCTAQECRLVPAPTNALEWSPDGRFLIRINPRSGRFYVRNLATRTERMLTTAISAHWADNNTVALVSWEYPQLNTQRITLFDMAQGNRRELVDLADLRAALPDRPQLSEGVLYIHDVLAWPGREDSYLVTVFPQDPLASFFPTSSKIHILAVETGRVPTVEHLATMQGQVLSSMALSPSGRWLANPVFQPETNTALLTLLDLENGQTETISYAHKSITDQSSYDWSADGNWLVVADRGVLRLIAPGSGYERAIVPPLAGCAYSAFVNR